MEIKNFNDKLKTDIKKERRMSDISFVAVAVSFLFFFNANIYVIDFLPDIIGYLILSFALVRLADLNDDISVSLKFFRYMILSEIGKLLSIMWLFGLSGNNEKNTGTLLIGFAFAVIDAILLFTAYGKLFSGLVSLGFAHSNKAVLGSRREGGRSYTEKIRSFTLFFVIFKSAMSVLPEFSNLAAYEYDESSGVVDLYEYIGLMRAMSFVITTVVGIFWLVSVLRYFIRVNRDKNFCSSLTSAYVENILPKDGLFIRRHFSTAFFFFIAAAGFMFDFRIDSFNIIPDTLGALFFLIGAVMCANRGKGNKLQIWLGGIFCLLTSVAAYVTEFAFYFKGYRLSSIYRREEIYNAYLAMSAASITQTVGFLVMSAVIIYCLRNVIKNHTGFVYGNDAARDRERLEQYHKKSQKKLWFLGVASVLVAASDIFYVFFAARFAYAGFIGVLATLIFFIAVIRTLSELRDEIDTKYMLD